MKSDIFLSEVVDSRETGAGVIDVCAAADGSFDRASSMLEVRLDAYLHNFAGEQFRPAWLPKRDTIREHVPHEEIHEVGRDIFQRWVRKVHETVPRFIPLGADGKPDPGADRGGAA
jgi:hypothetical protein